jgi:hypothetical protein
MQTFKLSGNIRKYLPLFTITVVMVLGMFIARDFFQTSTDAPFGTASQTLDGQTGFEGRPCISLNIYTSLPAKCKIADGKFLPVGEIWSNVFVAPEGK